MNVVLVGRLVFFYYVFRIAPIVSLYSLCHVYMLFMHVKSYWDLQAEHL